MKPHRNRRTRRYRRAASNEPKTRDEDRGRRSIARGDRKSDARASEAQSAIHRVARDVLLPYQVRWIADDAPVKVAEKSRRVGITWAEAADAALSAAAAGGMDT